PRQLDAAHGVADVEETSGLPALAVNRERVSDGSLRAEAVEHRAPYVVVVEARAQFGVHVGLLRTRAVDHSLVEVRRAQAPDAAREHDVVAVVDLRQVLGGRWFL